MGELRDKMARDLTIRNLAVTTQKEYLRCCCGFVRYHMQSPRELGASDIKEYLEQSRFSPSGQPFLSLHFHSSPLGLHRFAGHGGLHPLPPAGAPLARSSGACPSETHGWFALLSVRPFTVFPARPGFVGV